MPIRKLCLILTLIVPSGCRILRIDELDHDKRTPVTIRTDGYYYTTYVRPPFRSAGGEDIPETTYLEPVFLYQDNSCYVAGGSKSHDEIYELVEDEGYKETLRSHYGWGYFFTEGDEIKIQSTQILASGFTTAKIGVIELTGRILSDTSFTILTYVKDKDGNRTIGSDLYKFKANAPKPDSSNWVKDHFSKKKKKKE